MTRWTSTARDAAGFSRPHPLLLAADAGHELFLAAFRWTGLDAPGLLRTVRPVGENLRAELPGDLVLLNEALAGLRQRASHD